MSVCKNMKNCKRYLCPPVYISQHKHHIPSQTGYFIPHSDNIGSYTRISSYYGRLGQSVVFKTQYSNDELADRVH